MAVHVDIVADYDATSVRNAAADLHRDLERSGQESAQAWSSGFESQSPKLQASLNKVADATGKVRVEEEKLEAVHQKARRAMEEITAAEDKLVATRQKMPDATRLIADQERTLTDLIDRHHRILPQMVTAEERLAKSRRDLSFTTRDLNRVQGELISGSQAATSAMGGMANTAEGATSAMGGTTSAAGELSAAAGPVGMAAAVAVGSIALAGLGSIAADVAQALLVLPAAIGGVVAGVGTLMLGMQGFDQAFKDIRDPKKFAEDLQSLSPNAKAAATAIQGLIPAFDQLKNATQDALFAGVGQQLQQLSTTLGPTIQQATTGIASAFNQMFMGVTDQLMRPETQEAIKTFTTNIVTAFQNLTPAMGPLTQAFAQLTAAGSNALPQLATAAAKAASSFADFIDKASKSGQLQEWINQGVHALELIMPLVTDTAVAFMKWAPVGERILPAIVHGLDEFIKAEGAMSGAIGALLDAFGKIPDAIRTVGNVAIDVLNKIKLAINDTIIGPINAVVGFANNVNPFGNLPTIPTFGPTAPIAGPSAPNRFDDSRYAGSPFTPNAPGWFPGAAPDVAASPNKMDLGRDTGTPGHSAIGPNAVVPLPSSGTADRNGPTIPVAPYTGDPMSLLGGYPATASLYSAAANVLEAQQARAQAENKLNALQADNNTTAEKLQEARNDLLKKQQAEHEADLRLQEAKNSATEKNLKSLRSTTDSMNQIGAALDQDFGLSKGLAGLAENLVKFLGDLAAAPLIGQLNAMTKVNEQATGIQGGYGALGIMGAQNIAAGTSPLLGIPAGAPGGPTAAGYPSAGYPASVGAVPTGAPIGYSAAPSALQPTVASALSPTGITPSGDASSKAGIAQMIYTSALARGYSPAEAKSLVAYSIGESGLNPAISGGQQGDDEVIGLFQEKTAFSGGLSRAQRADPAANINAYLNQLAKHRGAGDIYDQMLATSVGGPMYTGGRAAMVPLEAQASQYLSQAPTPTVSTPTANTLNTGPIGAPGAAPSALGVTAGQGAPFGGPSMVSPQSFGPGEGPTQIGGVAPPQGTGAGGIGITPGGSLDTAMGLAGMAVPGLGQAAQTGVKEASRAIQFGSQAIGTLVGGAMETFLPTGGSDLANKSWLTRIVGGVAGAHPVLPNTAGKSSIQPQGQQPGQQNGQPGMVNNLTINNTTKDPEGMGQEVTHHLGVMYQNAPALGP